MESNLFEEYVRKSEEKIKSSKYLLKGGFNEDSVSRSYYSMYYAARALLSLKDIFPKTHKGVITELGLEFVKKGYVEEAYGKAISYAKDRREEVDYSIDVEVVKEEAEEILSNAKDFLQKVKEAKNKLVE